MTTQDEKESSGDRRRCAIVLLIFVAALGVAAIIKVLGIV